ncbi:MAG: rod shape-determining protein MreC [Candidatus Moraniibacteriota bacterium]
MNIRSVPRSRLFRATLSCTILVLFAVWGPQPVSGFLRAVYHTVLLPFERVSSNAGYFFGDTFGFISSIGNLKSENERLHDENLRLAAENATLSSLRTENDELRKFAGLETRGKQDLIAGEAVAAGQDRGFVLIDRGSAQGVSTGMPVLSASGALVGTVNETYPRSARVMLLTNSESAVGGITASDPGTKGVIRGDRGLGIAYSMVLRVNPLSVGDKVVTSGAGSGIPSGLFVGTVSSVQETEDRLFREATIKPAEEIGALRFLFVLKGNTGV